jgi:hypothetical protein
LRIKYPVSVGSVINGKDLAMRLGCTVCLGLLNVNPFYSGASMKLGSK